MPFFSDKQFSKRFPKNEKPSLPLSQQISEVLKVKVCSLGPLSPPELSAFKWLSLRFCLAHSKAILSSTERNELFELNFQIMETIVSVGQLKISDFSPSAEFYIEGYLSKKPLDEKNRIFLSTPRIPIFDQNGLSVFTKLTLHLSSFGTHLGNASFLSFFFRHSKHSTFPFFICFKFS